MHFLYAKIAGMNQIFQNVWYKIREHEKLYPTVQCTQLDLSISRVRTTLLVKSTVSYSLFDQTGKEYTINIFYRKKVLTKYKNILSILTDMQCSVAYYSLK